MDEPEYGKALGDMVGYLRGAGKAPWGMVRHQGLDSKSEAGEETKLVKEPEYGKQGLSQVLETAPLNW